MERLVGPGQNSEMYAQFGPAPSCPSFSRPPHCKPEPASVEHGARVEAGEARTGTPVPLWARQGPGSAAGGRDHALH